jgi:hypothetical protein
MDATLAELAVDCLAEVEQESTPENAIAARRR